MQNTGRNGSPIFYDLLDKMAEIHDKKSHDYASNNDPYGNYYFAGQLSQLFASSYKDAGFVGRLAEKLYRLANLESNSKIPQNESVEDTEIDICVIVILWMSSRRDRRAIKLHPEDNVTPGAENRQFFCVYCSKEFFGLPCKYLDKTCCSKCYGKTTASST